jgi:IS1 family transposase
MFFTELSLSFREVEELMLSVVLSSPTRRSGAGARSSVKAYANGLRRRRPRPGDKWHLDEVFVKINGEQRYLWRAVDADGNVLDILVQSRRDTTAARCFFTKLMKKTRSVPRVIVTDKLRSYGAAHRQAMPSVDHRSPKGLNKREQAAAVLSSMGLRLSEEKTKIVHIDEGFDFLAWRIQRHRKRGTDRSYVYTYPSKKALKSAMGKVKLRCDRIDTNQPLAVLLLSLGSLLRGWTAYFRPGVSHRTFHYLSHYTWQCVMRWLRRKHLKSSWGYLKRR